MKHALLITAAALSLGACAQRASSVSPVSMPTGMYAHLTCQQAANEHARIRERVATLERAQNRAATGDAVGVFFVLVPVGSLTGGDKSGELATAKGEEIAIRHRLATC